MLDSFVSLLFVAHPHYISIVSFQRAYRPVVAAIATLGNRYVANFSIS